jgi:hypothetical protein
VDAEASLIARETLTPRAFDELIKKEIEVNKELIKQAGLKPN